MATAVAAKRLLIVYHSQSGRNAQLAYHAAAAAVGEAGVELRLRRDAEASCRDVQWADGVVFFVPENFGALAGGMKDFFDRIFYPALEHQICCSYAIYIHTGNDGSQALAQLQRILSALPFREVSAPVFSKGELDDSAFQQAGELAAAMAAGLALGVF